MRRVMTTRIPPLHFSNARPLLACPPRPTNVQGCPHFACQEGWKHRAVEIARAHTDEVGWWLRRRQPGEVFSPP